MRMEWISVKDRLPDHRGQYLVAYNPCVWDSIIQEVRVELDSYRGRKGGVWAKNKYQHVTYWMPLPTPPEINYEDFYK